MKKILTGLFVASVMATAFIGCTSCESSACGCSATSSACACAQKCTCKECACSGAVGRWAIQRKGAFWLGIFKDEKGAYSASLLWGGGSPVVQQDVKVEGHSATIKHVVKKNSDPAKMRIRITKLVAKGCTADASFQMVDGTGLEVGKPEEYTAKRIPALPPAPDWSKAKFGEPIDLLAGGMDAWQAMGQNYFGWSIKDGVLSNRIKRNAQGKREGWSENIVTKRADFFDFKLSYDVRVLPECNSGVYLRGIYEIQVIDSYGKPVDCHNMAALYGRITPRVAAEKPANEWQHVDVMLYKRHVSVTLNGVNIIDNQPILGCTGGAITSDEFVKGPIYLQGDHSDADFRNMILTPIVK